MGMRIDVRSPGYRPIPGIRVYLDDVMVQDACVAVDTDEGWVEVYEGENGRTFWPKDSEPRIVKRYGDVRLVVIYPPPSERR